MRKCTRVLAIPALGVLLFLVVAWLTLFCTGHIGRAYDVLPPDAQTALGSQTVTLAQAAERYQPRLFMAQGTTSPPPLHMWYEGMPASNTLVLVYHPAWDNEVHPNRLVGMLYSVFRVAYYGYPLFDIEYIQIRVSTANGLVEGMRFETGFSNDYSNPVNEHLILTATRQASSDYLMVTSRKSGEFVREEGAHPLFQDESHLCLGVLTWNHLLVLREEGDERYTQPVRMGLVYLDNEDYARYKFARKSQGNYATQENKGWLFAALPLEALVIVLSSVWVNRRASRCDKRRDGSRG